MIIARLAGQRLEAQGTSAAEVWLSCGRLFRQLPDFHTRRQTVPALPVHIGDVAAAWRGCAGLNIDLAGVTRCRCGLSRTSWARGQLAIQNGSGRMAHLKQRPIMVSLTASKWALSTNAAWTAQAMLGNHGPPCATASTSQESGDEQRDGWPPSPSVLAFARDERC